MDEHKEENKKPVEEKELQPELKDMLEAISRYVAVNDGQVAFVGSFIGFETRCGACSGTGEETIDMPDHKGRLVAFGPIEEVRILLNELRDVVEDSQDEDGFVDI